MKKDARGKKISECEAKFGIAAHSIRASTVPISSEEMAKEMTANMERAVNAELL